MALLDSLTFSGDSDTLQEVYEEASKKAAKELAQTGLEASEARLENAANDRSDRGADSGLYNILEESFGPEWDSEMEGWAYGFEHRGAVFQDKGATSHEIEAKKSDVLAFEWPDAPEEVKDQFSHTEGDLVFFKSINHPGIPAINFMTEGRESIRQESDSVEVDIE